MKFAYNMGQREYEFLIITPVTCVILKFSVSESCLQSQLQPHQLHLCIVPILKNEKIDVHVWYRTLEGCHQPLHYLWLITRLSSYEAQILLTKLRHWHDDIDNNLKK